MRHRAILHNSFGIYLVEQLLGVYIINTDKVSISVRDIAEDHVIEDLGFIPTLDKCFEDLPQLDWLIGLPGASRTISLVD